ncbi:MAG: CsbD family protein [Dehalococcoidia bacterium]
MMQTTLRRSTIGSLRRRIRERWNDLTEDEIDQTGGSLDRLIDLIHERTGEARASIKRELRRIFAS